MPTKVNKVKVALDFNRATDAHLISICNAGVTGLTGNDKFVNPSVDLPTFKAQIVILAAAIAAAQDGGRKAVAEKNKQREITIKMLVKLARYVEETADNDLAVLTSSGFQPATRSTSSQSLKQPTIDKLVQDGTGQIAASPTPTAGARLYETRFGPLGPGGVPPASWTMLQSPSARPATAITGLTPGTIYAFQVRAYGKPGWTEWSDSVTKMST